MGDASTEMPDWVGGRRLDARIESGNRQMEWAGLPELGATYEDRYTGFSGIATAYTTYIGGRVVVRLERPANGNKPDDDVWLDLTRLGRVGGDRPAAGFSHG